MYYVHTQDKSIEGLGFLKFVCVMKLVLYLHLSQKWKKFLTYACQQQLVITNPLPYVANYANILLIIFFYQKESASRATKFQEELVPFLCNNNSSYSKYFLLSSSFLVCLQVFNLWVTFTIFSLIQSVYLLE